MKTLYLIDGSSFAYRAFYAIGHLSTSKGQPTNAVYGFTRMLRKLIESYNPPYLAVIFDKGKLTFRHREYEEYKAHRKPMPDALVEQIPWIKKMVSAYSIPLIELEDYEADDIIATLAVQAEKDGFNVYIVTGDKDMLQLVSPHIKVMVPTKEGFVYDKGKVKERYGIVPRKIPELLALTGDSSDNIPGVPGVGEKTAMRLLQNYGNIKRLLKAIDNIQNPKIKRALQENIDQIKQSLGLVILKKDVHLDIKPADCIKKKPQVDVLKDIFRELEFKRLLKELLDKHKPTKDDPPMSRPFGFRHKGGAMSEIVEDSSVWNSIFQELKRSGRFSVVIWDEDLGLAYDKNGRIKSIGVKLLDQVRKDIGQLMGNAHIAKYSYNLKSIFKVFMLEGVSITGSLFDVSIANYLLGLAGEDVQEEVMSLQTLTQKAVRVYKEVPLLEKRLIDEGLFDLYHRIELPLTEVLADMEIQGIKLDIDILKRLSKEFGEDLEDLTTKIYKLAGESFNINSPKQLEYILFEKLKLPKGKRTKTGYSTDVGVLSALLKYHELPGYLLEYRQLNKLKSSYIDPLPQMVNPTTGRLYTRFNQIGTATGRLSSADPNLQNIPIKTEFGKRIRQAFVPGNPDWLFLGADYSQIELRILAHLSGDKGLIRAFREDKDIHTATAQEIFEVEMDRVNPEMRRQAKMVNFGIVYGMGARSLAKVLDISLKDAQQYIDTYFERYPKVVEYIKNTLDEAAHNGYVVTMFGRKRVIPELRSSKPQIQSMGQRIAINTPLQGSAADIIKLAMISIYRRFNKENITANLLLQIHDELVFEAIPEVIEGVQHCVQEEMEQVVRLKVPLKVDMKVGRSWADL